MKETLKTDNISNIEYANQIMRRIVSAINPAAVMIFGSVARGEDTADSDIDMLVVWNGRNDLPPSRRRVLLWNIVGFTERSVDLLTYSSAEIELARKNPGSFASNVIREGRVIYGRLD